MAGNRTTGPLVSGLAALLLAAPAARAADIPGDKSTKATITPGPARFEGVLDKAGDSDWYRITLKAGRNYAFESASFCDTKVALRNAAGKVLKTSGFANDNGDDGFEFRSATTKDYFVEYFDAAPDVCLEYAGPYPHGYSGNVAMEVRGDTTTRGTIAPGQTIVSLLNWGYDQDFFRTQLRAGRSYTVTLGGANGEARPGGSRAWVVDPKGKVIAPGSPSYDPPAGFKVPKNGTYYVVVAGDDYDNGPYTVGLTTP
jgi:serralysin